MTTVTARIICLEDTSLFLHHWDEGELSAWRDKYNRVWSSSLSTQRDNQKIRTNTTLPLKFNIILSFCQSDKDEDKPRENYQKSISQ